MRAPLSVIVPTLNAEKTLPGCLETLMEGVKSGIIREVLISDGGSSDATLKIAKDAGCEVLTGPASRGGQLRRGADHAQGAWLWFVHADSRLSEGWCIAVISHMSQETAGYGRLKFDDTGFAARWVAGWANLRSRFLGLPYGDQSLLIPRTLYQNVGGFVDQPLMEDVAMARALRGKLHPLDISIQTSASRYQRAGWVRRGSKNLTLLIRYLLGASPETLAKSYPQ